MKRSATLADFEDHWVTAMGAWFPGERVVYRGKDLFSDMQQVNWIELLLYGITGREFSPKQLKLFDKFWTFCASYPEPRIWNNRIAALGGTARTTSALAIGAATAISEATIYGRRPDIRSIDFLYRAKAALDEGDELNDFIEGDIKRFGLIPGFGRPVVNGDERIKPVMKLAKECGLDDGLYLQLAFDVEEILFNGRRRKQMNIAMLLAAIAADQGLSSDEYYQFMVLCFSAGMFPCYLEARDKPEGAFFPLRCESIDYHGPELRKWKRIEEDEKS